MLAPALQQLLAEADWSPKSVELVAVAVGPGSFTGLRIGVTTAKTFAYAVGAEVIGVNTLDALAAQAPPSAAPLWTMLDAQRQELFAAKFIVDARRSTCTRSRDVHHRRKTHGLPNLQPGDRVTGPALSRLASRLAGRRRRCARTNSGSRWRQPSAKSHGKHYQAGQRDDVWKLAPQLLSRRAPPKKNVRHKAATRLVAACSTLDDR